MHNSSIIPTVLMVLLNYSVPVMAKPVLTRTDSDSWVVCQYYILFRSQITRSVLIFA